MRSTMYWSLLAAGLGLLVCPLTGSAQDQVWDSEIGWAKRVATEFFDSETSAEKTNGYSSSDSVFLSPELAAELRDNRFRWLTKLNWEYHGGRFWIKSAEISPAKTEVVLVCELAPPDPPKEPREGDKKLADKALDVTLWMAKDGGGAWRIRFIRAKVRPVQIQPHEAPKKTELKMKEPPKTAVSMGSPSSKPKKELGETPLRQLANWVRDSTPLGRSRYDSDPNYRMQRLLEESENLEQANAEIHRFWMNNQPSCLSYERLSGSIGDDTAPKAAVATVSQPSSEVAQATSVGDIAEMAYAGVSDEIILNQIRLTRATFAMSAKEIVRLKMCRVSDRVVIEMQNSRREPPRASERSVTPSR